MDVRSGPYYARKDVMGFIKQDQIFTVVEEQRCRYGAGYFLKLEDGGWVFSESRTVTFCVPVNGSWDSWHPAAATAETKKWGDTRSWCSWEEGHHSGQARVASSTGEGAVGILLVSSLVLQVPGL